MNFRAEFLSQVIDTQRAILEEMAKCTCTKAATEEIKRELDKPRKEILENRHQILDAIRKITEGNSSNAVSPEDINKIDKLIKDSQKAILDEIGKCKCAKEAAQEIKDKIDDIPNRI